MFPSSVVFAWLLLAPAQDADPSAKARQALASLRDRPSVEAIEEAERKIADLGEAALPALRDAVRSANPAAVALSVRMLQKWGSAEDAKILFEALQGNPAQEAVAPCVRALFALDPLGAPERALRLLDHKLYVVRAAAAGEISGKLRPEHAAEALRLSRSKREDTKVRALGLLGSFSSDECLERLLDALSDPFPEAAAAASVSLARSVHPQAQEKIDALIAQGYLDRAWSYSCLAQALKLGAHSGPVAIDPAGKKVELLQSALASKEAFVAGAAAVLLAQVGFHAPEGEETGYLDREVPEALVRAVASPAYYRDFNSLLPHAIRQLQILSGENVSRRSGEWPAWWLANRDGFRAMRWSSRQAFAEGGAFVLEWVRPGESPERIRFTAVEPEKGDGLEEEYWLDREQAGRVLSALRDGGARADALAAEQGQDRPVFFYTLGKTRCALSWARRESGPDSEQAFRALLQELRERNLWQLFADLAAYPDRAEFLRAEQKWWAEESKPELRALRLKGTILRALPQAPAKTKFLGLSLLQAQPELAAVLAKDDLPSFLAIAISKEDRLDVRSKAIALAAALGDAKSSAKLLEDLAAQDSPDARALLRKLFAALGAGAARRGLDHPRSSVRASAAEAFAAFRVPGSAEPILRLLEDSDFAVRRSAMYALGILGAVETLSAVIAAGEAFVPQEDGSRGEYADLRAEACIAAGRIGGEGAFPFLSRALADREPAVRSAAVQGLAEMPSGAGASLLAEIAFRDGEPDSAALAREHLLASPQESALSSLRKRLSSDRPEIRRQATLFLAELCDHSAAMPLAAILREAPQDAAALEAGSILTMRDLAAEKEAVALLEAFAARQAVALPSLDEAPERLEELRDKEWFRRVAALRALRVACVAPYPRLTRHSPAEEWERAYQYFRKLIQTRAEKGGL